MEGSVGQSGPVRGVQSSVTDRSVQTGHLLPDEPFLTPSTLLDRTLPPRPHSVTGEL